MTQPATTEITEITYYQQRLKTLGITQEQNLVTTKVLHLDRITSQTVGIFGENDKGDIEILYCGLNGMHTYQAGTKEKPYIRYRLHPDRCKDGYKYHTPRGAGQNVFFPPLLLELFNKKAEIPTLIITEGEFKAFKATMHGLPCIGLQGTHGYQEKHETGKQLNSEIELFIKTCQVKNVILLFDADCLQISYEPDKDLHKRPYSFYTAVRNFRELTKNINCDVYFSHIKPDAPGKGLDDLLTAVLGQEAEVTEELLTLRPGNYFHTQNITDSSLKKLLEYFHITSVESFYTAYEEILGQQPFMYQGARYEHNGHRLDLMKIPEAFGFLRIGDDYFKKVMKPNRLKELELILMPIKKTTILDDFKKKAANILDMINKYEGFCNVPDHRSHQEVLNGWYNVYAPLPCQPQEGEYAQSLAFVKHIFGEQYELGLDYIQLLYARPTQFLPVLCLVSNENNTGKSTFPKWLRALFGQNVTQCNNTELDSEFNDNFASKLVIYVDETFIEKRIIKERIKNLSTSEKITMNAKNKARQEIDFFGKFILCSNNEDNFVSIDSEDIRFWVRKIGKPETDNVNLLEELTAEAPAFLHFLSTRQMHYQEKKSRMWFPPAVLETEALQNVRESSRGHLEKAIRTVLRDKFLEFKVGEIQLTKKMLLDDVRALGITTNVVQVEECLKKKLNVTPGSNQYFYINEIAPRVDKDLNEYLDVITRKTKGMPYTFKAEDFLSYAERNNAE